MFCVGCNSEHEDKSWIYRDGWLCSKYFKPSVKPEFVPDRILNDRNEYFNSIVQPYRQGQLSKEFIDRHGTKGINATPKEIAKAKNVWKDLPGWHTKDNAR